MKIILKIVLVSISILTSGCAVKSNDSLVNKTLKHSLNSPLYAILSVGKVATKTVDVAVMSTSTVVVKIGDGVSKTIKNTNTSN